MGKPKILIVEDEPGLLGLMTTFLSEEYEVFPARRGDEGMVVFDNNHVSLVLLDIRLKGMDGIELLGHIRRKSATVPVIVLTGYSNHETAVRCADMSVQGYLLKPPKLEDLRRRIDSCLGTAGRPSDDEMYKINDSASPIVKIAMKVIHERFRDPALNRGLIAEAVGISDGYLGKQFHKECEVSIPEYINRLRMAEAARLLAATNSRVSEIAISLGISNLSYFSSIFKKHYKMTPEQYRREKRL